MRPVPFRCEIVVDHWAQMFTSVLANTCIFVFTTCQIHKPADPSCLNTEPWTRTKQKISFVSRTSHFIVLLLSLQASYMLHLTYPESYIAIASCELYCLRIVLIHITSNYSTMTPNFWLLHYSSHVCITKHEITFQIKRNQIKLNELLLVEMKGRYTVWPILPLCHNIISVNAVIVIVTII